jgi:hypothetical protein
MEGVGNSLFKLRLKGTFQQDLSSSIENTARASSYRLFSEFGFKEYLKKIHVV